MTDVNGNQVFPDVHHKMSKKIAQLTKVIYHLNTRNEDFQYQMQSLADSYESEIEEILHDAFHKINNFRSRLVERQNESRIAEAIAQLTAQHAREKQQALAEFEQFKQTARDREQELRRQCDQTTARLTQQLADVKQHFRERVSQFAQIRERLELEATSSKTDSRHHIGELEELVKTSNQKYNSMLAQMLQEKDQLRAQMQQEREDALKQLERDHQQQLKRLSEQEFEKRETELRNQRAELERLMDERRLEMQQKVVSLESDLDRLKSVEQTLNSTLSKQLDELSTLEDSVALLEKSLAESESTVKKLENHNAQLQSDLQSRQDRIQQMSEKIREEESNVSRLTTELEQLRSKLATMREVEQSLQTERDRIAQEANERSASEQMLHTQLMDAHSHIDQLRSELNSSRQHASNLDAELQAVKNRLEESEQKRKLEHAAHLEELRVQKEQSASEMEQLRMAHKEELQTVSNEHDKSRRNYESETERRIANLELSLREEFSKTKSNLESEHSAAIAASEEKYSKLQSELEQLKCELGNERDKFAKSQNDLQREMEKSIKEKSERIAQLEGQLVANNDEWERRCSQLNSEIETLKNSYDGLLRKIDELQSELSRAQSDSSESERQLNERIRQKELELNTTVEKLHKQREAELSEQRQRLNAEWNEKMNNALRDLQERLNGEWNDERSRLLQEMTHSSEEQRLRMQNEIDLGQEKILKLESEMKRLFVEYEELQQNAKLEATNLRTEIDAKSREFKMQIERLKEQHAKVISKLRDEHRIDVLRLEQEAKEERDRLLQDHVEQMQQREKMLSVEKETALAMQRNELATQREKELRELEDRKERERLASLEEMRAVHAAELKKRAIESEKVREEIQNELDQARAVLAEQSAHIGRLETSEKELQVANEDLCSQITQLHERLRQERDQFESDLQSLEARLRDEHKYATNALIEEHVQETRSLTDEFRRSQELLEERIRALNERCRELDERYENRESRPEDIEMIVSLQRDLAEREQQLYKAKESANLFKMELQNREDMYNKTFGRQPTLGKIDPLRAKTRFQGGSSMGSKGGMPGGSSFMKRSSKMISSHSAGGGGGGGGGGGITNRLMKESSRLLPRINTNSGSTSNESVVGSGNSGSESSIAKLKQRPPSAGMSSRSSVNSVVLKKSDKNKGTRFGEK